MISEQSKQEIHSKINIIEVIEDFITLIPSGKDYKAICPFHNERSPSFMVSPSKGIYKCFGCQKGGDAIKFIMELEGFSYYQALKYLAEKYQISVEYDENKEKEYTDIQNKKESLYIAIAFAEKFYTQILTQKNEDQIGYNYLIKRRLEKKTVAAFTLGYSKNNWTSFLEEAKKKGYKPEVLIESGLVVQKEQKMYDYFRGRIMFPIKNALGKTIGFGARALKKEEKVKYLNSPETLIYQKNKVLYGLYQAKTAIRHTEQVFLVEGYMDVIMLWQAGIENVVASSGTALSQDQIQLLKRYTQNIVVLYDSDEAGKKASLRAIEIILENGLQVEIITLPQNEDPDSFIQKVKREGFENYVKTNKQSFITFILQDLDLSIPLEKKKGINMLVNLISKIPDAVGRMVFFEEAAKKLSIDLDFLLTQSNKLLISEADKLAFKKRGTLSKNRQITNRQGSKNIPVNFLPSPPIPLELDENNHLVQENANFDFVIPSSNDPTIKSRIEHEKEFLRIILLHGHTKFDSNNLADYLFTKVKDINFIDNFIKKILKLYKQEMEKGKVLLYQFQQFCLEKNILDLTTSTELDKIIDFYGTPSKHWEKKNIIPKPLDSDIERVIDMNLLKVNYFYIQFLYEKLRKSYLKELETVESSETHAIIEQLKSYENQRRELGKKLGFMF